MIEEEIVKELNWKEKIIIKVFRKTFLKLYHVIRENIVNTIF